MRRLFACEMPDWSDPRGRGGVRISPRPASSATTLLPRANAARIWDRTPGTAPPVQMGNQMGMVFTQSAYIARTPARNQREASSLRPVTPFIHRR
jgi:hypothetical protein